MRKKNLNRNRNYSGKEGEPPGVSQQRDFTAGRRLKRRPAHVLKASGLRLARARARGRVTKLPWQLREQNRKCPRICVGMNVSFVQAYIVPRTLPRTRTRYRGYCIHRQSTARATLPAYAEAVTSSVPTAARGCRFRP